MSKKHKQLSDYEIQRRHKLRIQRDIQKKKAKRLFWIKAAVIIFLFLFFFIGMFLIDLYFEGTALINYMAILMIIASTLTDRCGLRRIIFRYYPENFIFGDYLKKSYFLIIYISRITRYGFSF